MKEAIKAWLLELTPPASTLACGVRLPDQTALCESYARDFPIPAVEKAWRSVADTFRVLTLHQIPSERMHWVYEKVTLHCLRRSDGLVFGIFVPRHLRSADARQIEELFQAFATLKIPPLTDT